MCWIFNNVSVISNTIQYVSYTGVMKLNKQTPMEALEQIVQD